MICHVYPKCRATTPLMSSPDNNSIVACECERRARGSALFPGLAENEMKVKKEMKGDEVTAWFETFDFAPTETVRLADYESPSKRALMQNP